MFTKTLFVLSCLVIAVTKAEIASFKASKDVFHQGEQIVLTCNLVKPIPFQATSHIDKAFGNESHRFEEENTLPGYTINREDGEYATMTLTIDAARSGDSGNYSCSLYLNHTTTSRYLFVAVEDEPDTIRLFVDDTEIANGSQPMTLKPNSAYRLRCETTGSNPPANISLRYGNLKLTPTNISNSSAILRYDLVGDNSPFVVPIQYNTTANITKWVFTADEFSKPLSCSAKVNANASGISVEFYPDIEDGPPLFVCNDTVSATAGQKDFPINCIVYSKPALKRASFFFNTGKANVSINGSPWGTEQSTADRSYRGIVKAVNDVKFVMTLTIGVTDPSAKIKFNFEAGNDKGPTIHDVEFSYKEFLSASSVKSVTTALLICTIFVSGFLLHA